MVSKLNALFEDIVAIVGEFPLQDTRFPRGGTLEPPRRLRSCGVSPVPLVPQESSILSLQLAKCGFYSIIVSKAKIF
ncbi:hypothetical protein QO000_003450 [Alkalihalobacillus hemicentroti]|uniref:Uncharacterized protein n=1 Tax=Guptibacillus hwajinpoensis TaxID=208199 RepID=A0ABU0K7K7_9BACL|nr:hypothetical protein [Alkalihalobacillus hemicentroti]